MMKKQTNEIVKKLLEEINMSSELEGHKAMMIAMKLYFEDGFRYTRLKELYDEIHKVCTGDVEKNIRVAIESAFTTGNPNVLYAYYGDIIPIDKDKPMAQQFIQKTIEIISHKIEA